MATIRRILSRRGNNKQKKKGFHDRGRQEKARLGAFHLHIIIFGADGSALIFLE
jgi:hypothetical protein